MWRLLPPCENSFMETETEFSAWKQGVCDAQWAREHGPQKEISFTRSMTSLLKEFSRHLKWLDSMWCKKSLQRCMWCWNKGLRFLLKWSSVRSTKFSRILMAAKVIVTCSSLLGFLTHMSFKIITMWGARALMKG